MVAIVFNKDKYEMLTASEAKASRKAFAVIIIKPIFEGESVAYYKTTVDKALTYIADGDIYKSEILFVKEK